MLKTGIVSSAYFKYDDFNKGLKEMSADGYDCCDYHGFIRAESPLYRYSEDELKAYLLNLSKQSKEFGIEFSQLHAQWPLKCETNEDILRSIDIVKKSIIGASYLNCQNVVVHTFAPFGWDREVDEEVTFKTNVDIFVILADFAKKYNVNICIENLPFVNLAISKVDSVLELIKAVGRGNCKMCFDVGHAHVFHDNLPQDILKIGKYLQVLHVHDNKGDYDSHMFPWQGNINWGEFTRTLKEINFSGCISLETYIGNNVPTQIKMEMRKILSKIAKLLADI